MLQKLNFKKYISLLLTIVALYSCTHKEKLIYFQGDLLSSETNKDYSPTLKTDDMISINVMGLDEQASKPFNLQMSNSTQNIGGYIQGTPSPSCYLIDKDGNIEFPIIGKIKIGGLTRVEAIEVLRQQLKPYLNNPTIIIRILNFKITVLGEVKHPGTFTIPNERITLPEALGLAGDLEITGIRKNVLVIRDVNGKKIETRVDLTTKEVFSSSVFYLQQNDVIYVEPNRAKINSSLVNTSNVSMMISIISLFITMTVLFRQ